MPRLPLHPYHPLDLTSPFSKNVRVRLSIHRLLSPNSRLLHRLCTPGSRCQMDYEWRRQGIRWWWSHPGSHPHQDRSQWPQGQAESVSSIQSCSSPSSKSSCILTVASLFQNSSCGNVCWIYGQNEEGEGWERRTVSSPWMRPVAFALSCVCQRRWFWFSRPHWHQRIFE